jgi:copper chaperone
MTCDGCSGAVERVLGRMKGIPFRILMLFVLHGIIIPIFYCLDKGVDKVEIDLKGQRVYVTSTLGPDEVLEAIKKTGKETKYIGVKA